jgi:hypothetical protein
MYTLVILSREAGLRYIYSLLSKTQSHHQALPQQYINAESSTTADDAVKDFFQWRINGLQAPDKRIKWRTAGSIANWSPDDLRAMADSTSYQYQLASHKVWHLQWYRTVVPKGNTGFQARNEKDNGRRIPF